MGQKGNVFVCRAQRNVSVLYSKYKMLLFGGKCVDEFFFSCYPKYSKRQETIAMGLLHMKNMCNGPFLRTRDGNPFLFPETAKECSLGV